jgi:hypothetical protein
MEARDTQLEGPLALAADLDATTALPALPLRIDDITKEWLTEARAARYPGVEVSAARIGRVMYGTSTKVWVHLEYNGSGLAHGLPPSMVLKGGFEEHSRNMAFMYNYEMRFYRDVAPALDMNTPTCYFAATNRGQGQSIVLLEDLTLKDMHFFDAQQPLGYRDVAAFLDAQARYHAQWWGSPALEEGGQFGWISTPLGGVGAGGYASRCMQPEIWEEDNWRGYLARPHGAALPLLLHDPDRIRTGLVKLGQLHEAGVRTLAHGDTHLGNLYAEAGGKPGFLDAQVRRSVWYQDVAYYMVAALDVIDRRNWERGLLNYYLGRLAAYSCTPPSFEEAWLCYRCEVAFGFFIWIINSDRFQSEATNTAVAARFGMAAIDHSTFDLLR